MDLRKKLKDKTDSAVAYALIGACGVLLAILLWEAVWWAVGGDKPF